MIRRGPRRLALLATGLTVAAALAWTAWRWTFVSRLATYPHGADTTTVDWYEPCDVVPGAPTAPLPTTTPAAAGFDEARLTAVLDDATRLGSAAFLVLRAGRIAAERYGPGAGPDRPTVGFSMSKTLLGLLCGTALTRGEVAGLDAPIGAQLDEWRAGPRGAITWHDLLAMRSGLVRDAASGDPFSDLVRMHLSADLLPVVLDVGLAAPPGTRWEYNNVNAQVLGIALERATGARFATLLQERLWRPLGAGPAHVWLDRVGGNAKVYGGVLATARDWARVGELIRNRGRVGDTQVVDAGWIETMLTADTGNPRYGLHVWRSPGDPARGAPPFVYLDGRAKQRVWIVRAHELVVVRTGERPPPGVRFDDDAIVGAVVRALRDG